VTKDFEELLGLLRRRGVRAVIVGAHALAHHAKPRYTKDIDILVDPNEDNARLLLEVLEEFGFEEAGIRLEDLTTPGMIIQLGYPPSRIDIMTSISGVTFDEVWDGRVEASILGQQFAVIGRQELIRNKRASGRTQDLVDLEWLSEETGNGKDPD
jgi:hypothetical protein